MDPREIPLTKSIKVGAVLAHCTRSVAGDVLIMGEG
jgi:hypothetical protein